MRFIKEEFHNAVQYYKQHNCSITFAAAQFHVERHSLAKYIDFDFSDCIYVPERKQYVQLNKREQDALKAYQDGTVPNAYTIEKVFHVKSEAFHKICKFSGIDEHKDNIKHQWNRDALQSITTEWDAYVLGFITADGYINENRGCLSFKLHERDIDILEKINQYFHSDIQIYHFAHAITKHPMCQLTFNSRKLTNTLIAYGLCQAKSLKEKFYPKVPQELMRHYIRGLIDGDGFIRQDVSQIGLCGSKDIVSNVAHQINLHMTNPFEEQRKIRQEKDSELYRFGLSGENAREAMIWLYKDSTIYINRKYALAQKYVKL